MKNKTNTLRNILGGMNAEMIVKSLKRAELLKDAGHITPEQAHRRRTSRTSDLISKEVLFDAARGEWSERDVLELERLVAKM